jgi:hypothetical protein
MVMASGSGLGWWPVATAGVLDKDTPLMATRPPGYPGSAIVSSVCDETPQISMGFM